MKRFSFPRSSSQRGTDAEDQHQEEVAQEQLGHDVNEASLLDESAATNIMIVPDVHSRDGIIIDQNNNSIEKSNEASAAEDGVSPMVGLDTSLSAPVPVARVLGKALLTLPNDALHGVASFLPPEDWKALSQSSKQANKACKSVWKRVRMHGFKCATNIATAWVRGELSDARELTGLYCSSGVPVYPSMCQGFAHPTILWRMGCEATRLYGTNNAAAADDASSTDPPNANQPLQQRSAGSGSSSSTGTVAMDRFYAERYEARHDGGYYPPMQRLTYLDEKCLFWRHYQREHGRATGFNSNGNNGSSNSTIKRSLSESYHSANASVAVSIHKHLFDQHLIGSSAMDDEREEMHVPVSLSADFFHPSRNYGSGVAQALAVLENSPSTTTMGGVWELLDELGMARDRIDEVSTQEVNEAVADIAADVYSAPVPQGSSSFSSTPEPLKVWTAMDEALVEAQQVFEKYRRELESFFDKGEEEAFDECFYDFWDEFFKVTNGISHVNRHTAVPRLTKLKEFLSRPCPKGIGIVQCEIERVVSANKKQTVKGRLFPTYDYRLFIRGRSESPDQKDTYLMTAKNIGRHGSKRGVNNYVISIANPSSAENGDEEYFDDSPEREIGRLQSNFIGTEFQIFSRSYNGKDEKHEAIEVGSFDMPQSRPTACRSLSPDPACSSGDEREDGAMSSRLMSKIGSLSSLHSSFTRGRSPSRQSHRRSTSWPKMPSRTSRRAIAVADAAENEALQISPPHALFDETEEGAITYTANLLGNRPRVMDVCIPKVDDSGAVQDWRQVYGGEMRMLQCFKQMQEQLNAADPENGELEEPSDFGLLALQNKQPWWNVELGAFVLNFGGRVSVASVKNFQLCARNDQEHIMLQFGRVQGRHSFTMDFQFPLTATQAFAIAISSLQSKISLG
mmetsp:Transcript_19062/g.28370  ORF Transcript_19062/g.28370 Transcript_19062/m.28370 type:complete len:908 (-) Transcript_19062:181-2904(-)|eukprot:CAMPEP_0116020950 /NCGR_PEP_ID=MMETSP0321-20121206/10097_1 /TAXON_ID=163516 /ORGANISM="Leptocylindrus danicus var. danicus, Strain B650" /LENGTH=907 /DNA_ID=CAMNT_0003491729 /DNA_START=287 /DNA_END=3013 /DNA_ORIENTATION=-